MSGICKQFCRGKTKIHRLHVAVYYKQRQQIDSCPDIILIVTLLQKHIRMRYNSKDFIQCVCASELALLNFTVFLNPWCYINTRSLTSQMPSLPLLLIALHLYLSQSQYLDTQSGATLAVNSSISSPLGLYRLRLLPNCSLELSVFSAARGQFTNSGIVNSSGTPGQSCTQLTLGVIERAVLADAGRVWRRLNGTSNYSRLTLGVNDLGVVELLGFQVNLEGAMTYSLEGLNAQPPSRDPTIVTNFTTGYSYTNKNNWTFSISNGLVTISKPFGNGTMIKNIDLRGVRLEKTGLADAQGETKLAAVDGRTWRSKAKGGCGKLLGASAVLDEYWPSLRVLDNDAYVVAQYSVSEDAWPCPQKSFEHKGDCLPTCPSPYYKQMYGSRGECALHCETGLIVNQTTRTCVDPSQPGPSQLNYNQIFQRGCPRGSQPYQFGCVCQAGAFYEHTKNTCVEVCPSGFTGANGLCMQCPRGCKSCQVGSAKVRFLACLSCQSGYSGTECQPTQCNIPRCAECLVQNNQTQCQRCEPFYALSSSKLACSTNCPANELPIPGPTAQILCVRLGSGSQSDYIAGVYNNTGYLLLKQDTCPTGLLIMRDRCVAACPSSMEANSQRRCICRNGEAMFWNDTCYQVAELGLLGYYYNFTYNNMLPCPSNCLRCQSAFCLKCAPMHMLLVTARGTECRQLGPYTTCQSQFYTYDSEAKICASSALINALSNITNCRLDIDGRCLGCRQGFVLGQAGCVKKCPAGYFELEGACLPGFQDCGLHEVSLVGHRSKVGAALLGSPGLLKYTQNMERISNDPVTEVLITRLMLGIPTTSQLQAVLYAPKLVCRIESSAPAELVERRTCHDPTAPYLFPNGSCGAECPSNMRVYIPQSRRELWCLQQTTCELLDESTPFELADGSCVSECPQGTVATEFGDGRSIQCVVRTLCQYSNMTTPFRLGEQCTSACSAGTNPVLINGNELVCSNLSQVPEPLLVDSTSYVVGIQGNQSVKLFYFVINQVLNSSNVKVNYIARTRQELVGQGLEDVANARPYQLAQFNGRTYLGIMTTAEQVILDFTPNIEQLSSEGGSRLGSSIYGVSSSSNHLHNAQGWLAIIAYVLSLVLICLHSLYIGNSLLYKLDNWLIFAQGMYYFSFVHLLINASIDQFYYGFLWAHFGFFPNYFATAIPPNYMEGFTTDASSQITVPNPYRLLTGDANFIRNAGFSFSLLVTFIGVFVLVCALIAVIKTCCGRYELWYRRVAQQALVAGFQFVSMNIFYWAVAHLLCNRGTSFSGAEGEPQQHVSFRISCSIASIVLICLYGVYMVVRFYFNKVGGLYMFKRLAFATILASSGSQVDDSGKEKLFLIPLVFLQILFLFFRLIIEQPYLTRQKAFIFLESILMMVAYITAYIWNDTGFVSIYVSLIIFLFVFLFVEDLLDVYLDTRDQYYDDSVKLFTGLRHKQFGSQADSAHLAAGVAAETDRRLNN